MKYLKSVFLCSLCFFLFCTGGCGKNEDENMEKALQPTGIMVPVAKVSSIFSDISYAEAEALTKDGFYYVKKMPESREDEFTELLFLKKPLDDLDKEEILWRREIPSKDRKSKVMALDEAGNLYDFFSKETNGEEAYFLGKWNREGKQLYELPITDIDKKELQNMAGGAANADGELILYNWSGKLFCFDKEGELTHSLQMNTAYLEKGSLFACADRFFWYENMGSEVRFYHIDTRYGTNQVWLATTKGLSEYNLQTGQCVQMFLWDNPHINLDGSNLYGLVNREDGSLQLLFHSISVKENSLQTILRESALISEQDEGLLPPKETITLGTTIYNGQVPIELEETVRLFNRSSSEYVIQMLHYFPRDKESGEIMDYVSKDILLGKAPDIIDISGMDVTALENKGIFENLEPYWIIQQKDLLENVWEEGVLEGSFRVVSPFFGITTLVTHDRESGQGWTFEEYIEYIEAYPGTPLVLYQSNISPWHIALFAGRDGFVNMEEKKCDFLNDDFIRLLKGIKSVNSARPISINGSVSRDEIDEIFERKDILIREITFRSAAEFSKQEEAYGKADFWKGYPSKDGTPCHQMFTNWRLVINSASENKEGAWAFLEFLLSEEIQAGGYADYRSFPVRKDAFEKGVKTAKEEGCLSSPEEEAAFRNLIMHSQMEKSGLDDHVLRIIYEESGAFFAGDKTAWETAAVIQNRMQLYL